MKIVAYIFGIGAMLSLFMTYQQKKRSSLIIAKLLADVCWVVHYLCLGGFAGAIPNGVGVFRELVFVNRKKAKWLDCALWPILFIIINLGLGISTFHTVFNVLPIVASACVTVALWIDNQRLTKLICLPVAVAFIVYDLYIGSYIGVINESVSIISILIFFIKEWKKTMNDNVFSSDCVSDNELKIIGGAPISETAKTLYANVGETEKRKGDDFAQEIADRFVTDFEKPCDKMAHVSTFIVTDGTVFTTYYANVKEPSEDPENQTARLVYAPLNDIENKTFIDLQTTGDAVGGKVIDMVYDTVLMQKDADTLYVMWTARTEQNYYRFYCPFSIKSKKLGKIGVNRFKVNDTVNDFSISGIKSALAKNGVACKKMYSDIGIMQKLSYREENGKTYYYTGTYSGDFNCIIKSADLITWEYVAQPDFINDSKWENATYVYNDKVYYFVRQQDTNKCGFLTAYDLKLKTWAKPVEIEDCQSRGDFILYKGGLYLFHAPINREHIGIVKVDVHNVSSSKIVLQAKMHTSCFYPFVNYFSDGELAMSYTVERKHIRLAKFTLSKYL
ncbi:MAG: YgjV family protein [Clostridia bacterium]|nr:YgjV family protein [Clostridia bacterium]